MLRIILCIPSHISIQYLGNLLNRYSLLGYLLFVWVVTISVTLSVAVPVLLVFILYLYISQNPLYHSSSLSSIDKNRPFHIVHPCISLYPSLHRISGVDSGHRIHRLAASFILSISISISISISYFPHFFVHSSS